MSASTQCHHPDLHFDLHHVHLLDSNVHYLDIKARCTVCGARMLFQGCPMGVTPKHPTMSLDGGEIHLPMFGEGEQPTGKQIGFSVVREVVGGGT